MSIEIKARLDTTELEEKEAEWRTRLRALNLEIQRTKLELRRTQLFALGLMGSVVSMASTFVNLLPEPFRAIGQAAIGMLQNVIATIWAISVAYASSGPVGWVFAIISLGGLMVASMAMVSTIEMAGKVDADMQRFQSSMTSFSSSLQGIMSSLGV